MYKFQNISLIDQLHSLAGEKNTKSELTVNILYNIASEDS